MLSDNLIESDEEITLQRNVEKNHWLVVHDV